MRMAPETDRNMIPKLVASFACTVPLIGLAILNYFEGSAPDIPKLHKVLFSSMEFLLVLAIIVIHRDSLSGGLRSLVRRKPDMNAIILLCTSAIAGYSVFEITMVIRDITQNIPILTKYYSANLNTGAAAIILSLYALGQSMEEKSLLKTATEASRLATMASDTFTIFREGMETLVKTEELRTGDIVVFLPGSIILVDGVIVEGETTIDASAVAGERFPSVRRAGDLVWSGSINISSAIRVIAEKVQGDTKIADIQRLVKAAREAKKKSVKVADRASGWFIIISIGLACGAAIVRLASGAGANDAILSSLSVFIVACPCALGIAAPLAILAGTRRGAKLGIFITSNSAFETEKKLDTIIINKRGTITEGKPSVTDVVSLSELDDNELLSIAASVQSRSEFPLATAIVSEARRSGLAVADPEDFAAYPEKGIEAVIRGKHYYSGGPVILQEHGISIFRAIPYIGKFAIQGKIPFTFGCDGKLLGIVAVSDAVKNGSKDAITAMKDAGLDVIMLTNENVDTAEGLRQITGISRIFTEFSPEGKAKIVANLKKDGHAVAMIGDSVNDAPALEMADISMKIGEGPAIAISSADIILEGDKLISALTAIELVRSINRTIRQNIVLAFLFNAVGVTIAAGAILSLSGLMHISVLTVSTMGLSAASIALNSLRLGLFHREHHDIGDRRWGADKPRR
jgi:heavy metal translocating P-type ATPase